MEDIPEESSLGVILQDHILGGAKLVPRERRIGVERLQSESTKLLSTGETLVMAVNRDLSLESLSKHWVEGDDRRDVTKNSVEETVVEVGSYCVRGHRP